MHITRVVTATGTKSACALVFLDGLSACKDENLWNFALGSVHRCRRDFYDEGAVFDRDAKLDTLQYGNWELMCVWVLCLFRPPSCLRSLDVCFVCSFVHLFSMSFCAKDLFACLFVCMCGSGCVYVYGSRG